jgi:Rap1a immunity proteins
MRVGIVTGLLALSQGALAQPTGMVFWSGNDLHSALQQRPASYARTLARGYLMGMSDLYSDMQRLGYVPWSICFPDNGRTDEQLADTVQKYLLEHPESRDVDAGGLVLRALTDAFPCRRP